jgi:hypothetical protein
MLTVRPILRPIAAGLLGFAACVLGNSRVRASDYGTGCAPSCHYKTVTVCVPKTVAYTKLVTLYDHCGRPYQVV